MTDTAQSFILWFIFDDKLTFIVYQAQRYTQKMLKIIKLLIKNSLIIKPFTIIF